MIPQEIVDFIYSSQVVHIGSRDKNLIPIIRHGYGVNINATKEVMIVYGVQAHYEQMSKNFNDNGRVSVILVEWPSHRCFQFKGQFLQAREMTPDDVASQQQYREKGLALVKEFLPEEIAERVIYPADLAIEFKVETIFDQTPGPGAGQAIELAS